MSNVNQAIFNKPINTTAPSPGGSFGSNFTLPKNQRDPSLWLDEREQAFCYQMTKIIQREFYPWLVESVSPLNSNRGSTLVELYNPQKGDRTWMKLGQYFWEDVNGLWNFRAFEFVNKYYYHFERITLKPKGPYTKKRPDWNEEGLDVLSFSNPSHTPTITKKPLSTGSSYVVGGSVVANNTLHSWNESGQEDMETISETLKRLYSELSKESG